MRFEVRWWVFYSEYIMAELRVGFGLAFGLATDERNGLKPARRPPLEKTEEEDWEGQSASVRGVAL